MVLIVHQFPYRVPKSASGKVISALQTTCPKCGHEITPGVDLTILLWFFFSISTPLKNEGR
jgi:hypothetical protein